MKKLAICFRYRETHPVVRRFDARWQSCTQLGVIHVGMQVGQDRPFRLDPPDPVQRLVEIEVAGVRRLAQRVDDPDVETGQKAEAFWLQTFDVGRVGDVADAKAERGY